MEQSLQAVRYDGAFYADWVWQFLGRGVGGLFLVFMIFSSCSSPISEELIGSEQTSEPTAQVLPPTITTPAPQSNFTPVPILTQVWTPLPSALVVMQVQYKAPWLMAEILEPAMERAFLEHIPLSFSLADLPIGLLCYVAPKSEDLALSGMSFRFVVAYTVLDAYETRPPLWLGLTCTYDDSYEREQFLLSQLEESQAALSAAEAVPDASKILEMRNRIKELEGELDSLKESASYQCVVLGQCRENELKGENPSLKIQALYCDYPWYDSDKRGVGGSGGPSLWRDVWGCDVFASHPDHPEWTRDYVLRYYSRQ